METENVFESARFAEGDLVEVLDTPNVRWFTEKAIGHRMTLTRTNARDLNAEGVTTEGDGYGQKYPVNYLSNDLRIIARASDVAAKSTSEHILPFGSIVEKGVGGFEWLKQKLPSSTTGVRSSKEKQPEERQKGEPPSTILLTSDAGVREGALVAGTIEKDDPLEKYLLDPKPFRSSKRKTKGKLITI